MKTYLNLATMALALCLPAMGQNIDALPTITGSAFVMAEGVLLQDPQDPFRSGIR